MARSLEIFNYNKKTKYQVYANLITLSGFILL